MKLIPFFILAAALCSCAGGNPEHVSAEKKKNIEYALSPQRMLVQEAVDSALARASEAQKTESRRLFMTGLDLLANKNNAAASVEYFKEAICYYPDEKSYSYLFQAYLKNNELADAEAINSLLAHKFGSLQTSYNDALLAATRKDTALCLQALDDAAISGSLTKEQVVDEKLFDFVREKLDFQSLLATFFGSDEKVKRSLFAAFIKSIPVIALPFEVPADSAHRFDYDHYINYNFASFVPGMEDNRFARNVSNEFMYVGRFPAGSGQAVIYKSIDVMGDTLNPVSTRLITYDSLGNTISTAEIACYCSPLEIKGFVLNADHSLQVKTFENKWEWDPLEKGYAGNKIVSTAEKSTSYYLLKGNELKEAEKPAQVASSGQ